MDASDFLPSETTINDVMSSVVKSVTDIFMPPPQRTAQVPAPAPGFSFNPATWGLTTWLLVGGLVFILARQRTRHNPHVSAKALAWRRRQRHGSIMKPSTFAAIERRAARGGSRDPSAVAGAAYWRTVGARYRESHNPFPASGMVLNPRHRRRSVRHGSPIRFHGAFADAGKAEARAARLGGIVRLMTVRGQRRYSVITAA